MQDPGRVPEVCACPLLRGSLAPQTQRTKPLIPEMCFTSTGCSTDINLSTPYLEEDGTSLLVSCKKCSVRVHASECLTSSLHAVSGQGHLIKSFHLSVSQQPPSSPPHFPPSAKIAYMLLEWSDRVCDLGLCSYCPPWAVPLVADTWRGLVPAGHWVLVPMNLVSDFLRLWSIPYG